MRYYETYYEISKEENGDRGSNASAIYAVHYPASFHASVTFVRQRSIVSIAMQIVAYVRAQAELVV